MAYTAIPSRAGEYGSYTSQTAQNQFRRIQSPLYLPKDITDTIMPQQSQSQKYPISKLSCLGQYKNNDGKPAYKFPTLPLSDYMGGKRTYPTHSSHLQHSSYSANSLKSMRKSYSKS